MKKLTDQIAVEDLRKIITLKYLSMDELDTLFEICEFIEYEDSEEIILQDTLTQGFYAVLDGQVKVVVEETNGKEVYICTIGKGEVFGEAGMFLKVKRTASVVALDKATVLKINRNGMMSFIRKFPEAGVKILLVTIYSLLRKLHEANQELAYERQLDASQGDVDDIVAEFLNG
jgi:CRP/FNR family cyclic AMP-dependent transcriptional regulator